MVSERRLEWKKLVYYNSSKKMMLHYDSDHICSKVGFYVKGSNLGVDKTERILGNVQRIELSGGRVCSEYLKAQRLDEEVIICTTQSVGVGVVIEDVQKNRKMLSVGEGGRRP
jgi:hypothetical protein